MQARTSSGSGDGFTRDRVKGASGSRQRAYKDPELRYRIRFTNTGTFPVTVFRLPSLDERGAGRVAIAFDDLEPVVLTGQAIATANRGDAWARNVEEGIEKLTGALTVTAPGEHVLRMLMVDPAIAVDQIVVDTGGLPVSYLAPPATYHRAFDNEAAATPRSLEEER
ncbi:hypothetical protein ABT009_38145 [Streptomyces sp. NPDC002896]|uniref:hypothetical protein n=1 Tax=Streptomyces sp. NPDC002896 TaxID=3154438 RepID=UPI003328FD01